MLTVNIAIGRKTAAQLRSHGLTLARVKPADLLAAGVERVFARTVGVRDGQPVLEDGRVLEVANVIYGKRDEQIIDYISSGHPVPNIYLTLKLLKGLYL